MSGERESVARTLLVAGGVALFCSLLVSTAVYWLRPIQAAYASMERNRAIVTAAGLNPGTLSDREIVNLYLAFEVQLADLSTDRLTDADAGTVTGYDYRDAINDPAQTEVIAPTLDVAGIGRRPRRMPLYLEREGDAIERIVLPVYGRGMWSTIYGFVGLGADLATVVGVTFYEHGETPGIGDRIQNDAWLAGWTGKRIYADDGSLVLRVGGPAGNAASTDRVDAITGATVTVTAVDGLIRSWFGENGYGPLLDRLREGGP
jgi:Na+-transporting NADH:ubiquinone oxidoreductase subunit C